MRPLSLDSINIRYDAADSLSFVTLIKLGLYSRNDQEKFAQKALSIAQHSGTPLKLGLAYMTISSTAFSRVTIDTCMNKAIQIFRTENLPNLEMLAQLQGASGLMNIGENYVKSFTLASQFLAKYNILEDKQSFALAWNILGEIYRNIQNNSKALECYKKANAYSYEGTTLINAAPLINIGTIYKNLGKYDSAFYFYDMVLASDTSRNGSKYAYIINRKAQVYLLLQNYTKAKSYVNESLSLYKKLNNQVGTVLALSTLTQLHFLQKQFGDCTKSGEQAIKLALQIDFFPEELMESCKLVVNVFEKNGEFDKALYYQKIYDNIYIRLFGPSVNLQMLNEQLGLEARNQELEKSLLRKNQKQAEENIRNQRQILFGILGALVLSLIALLLLFSKNRTIRSLNNQLQERQDEILTQSEELKATNEEIETMNSNLESIVKERSQKVLRQNQKLTEYAYFNAHKVRGPLARILGLIGIMELDLKKESIPYSEMLKQAGYDLDESIREINSILETDKPGDQNSSDSLKQEDTSR